MKSRPPAKLAQDQTTQRQINGQRVEEALEAASGADQVLVLALDDEGRLSIHTTIEYVPDMLWTFELARKLLLESVQELNA